MTKKDQTAEKSEDARTPWEKFVGVARHVVNVPKEEIERREAAYRKKRAREKRS